MKNNKVHFLFLLFHTDFILEVSENTVQSRRLTGARHTEVVVLELTIYAE